MLVVTASLIARLLVEPGVPVPDLADDNVLLVKRHDVTLAGCVPGDAGVPLDAGDAGNAGVPPDAGDAGVPPDASDAGPADAGASCGPGDAITLVVKPRVSITSGIRFAILFVTPSRPVLEAIADPFPELAAVTAPVTVINRILVPDPSLGSQCTANAGCNFSYEQPTPPIDWNPPGLDDANLGDGAVVSEPVGPYEIVRAQPADAAQLATWLAQLGYAYSQADLDAVAPYIARGFTVVAVRIANGYGSGQELPPISLTWAGSTLSLPAALGSGSPTPTTVYIAADGRYDLPGANVSFADINSLGETQFLTRNEIVLAPSPSPDADPVASPSSLGVFVTTLHQDMMIKVPVEDCGDDFGCCSAQRRPRVDLALIALAVVLVVRRRRR